MSGRWHVGNGYSGDGKPWPILDDNGGMLCDSLGRKRWFATAESAQRAADKANRAEAALQPLAEIARRLRETAEGLREWVRTEDGSGAHTGCVHPMHAANRLEKLAREIDGGRK